VLPTDDDFPEKPIRALFEEAEALQQAARWEDAARSYDAVLARLDGDSDREAKLALHTLYLKIVCLHEQGDAQGALAACDALLASYSASDDEKTIRFVADALWLKSRALGRLGDVGQERMVHRHLIEQYADEPGARSQVARAMYNEGIHLRDTQRGDEAIEMWDQLFLSFAADPPHSDRFIPIRGQLAKSRYLAETDRLEAALVTCDRMLKECSRLDLPEARLAEVRRVAHGCIAIGRRSKGLGGRLRALGKRR
jgi:tetratricopeptide (TPR) repeat protein